jgi:saxitoxin biosynthesis operon SxtJ-like protein
MSRRVKSSSNRTFGLTFAVVFALAGCWPWLVHGRAPYLWAWAVALGFCAAALVAPRVLTPLNRLWFWFGLALHHLVNPIVMALIYYGAVVPMGLAVRVAGKDLLRLRRDPAARTYWIAREPPGPAPKSMAKQF